MQRLVLPRLNRRNRRLASFTLVELLIVIGIIILLASMTLAAAIAVQGYAARSRAKSEIAAWSTLLEIYKTDNGSYPIADINFTTSTYTNQDGSSSGYYQTSSQLLYQSLSGKTNFTDTLVPGTKVYYPFTIKQLGSPKGANSVSTYITDPWGYSYAYATGDGTTNNPPYSGFGFYDLWSTGSWTTSAKTGPVNPTNMFIKNWQ